MVGNQEVIMTNFISVHREYTAHDKKGRIARFVPAGDSKRGTSGKMDTFGKFSTNDPKIIKRLLALSNCGTGAGMEFNVLKGKMPKFENPDIVKGAVTSSDGQRLKALENNLKANSELELSQEKEKLKTDIGEKYMRFGELKANLLKNDGEYRADASDVLKEEYELLKTEIGE